MRTKCRCKELVTSDGFFRRNTAEPSLELPRALGQEGGPHLQKAIRKTWFKDVARNGREIRLKANIRPLPELVLATLKSPQSFWLLGTEFHSPFGSKYLDKPGISFRQGRVASSQGGGERQHLRFSHLYAGGHYPRCRTAPFRPCRRGVRDKFSAAEHRPAQDSNRAGREHEPYACRGPPSLRFHRRSSPDVSNLRACWGRDRCRGGNLNEFPALCPKPPPLQREKRVARPGKKGNSELQRTNRPEDCAVAAIVRAALRSIPKGFSARRSFPAFSTSR